MKPASPFLISLIVAVLLIGCRPAQSVDTSSPLPVAQACFETHCFSVEVASTLQTRQQGLMDRHEMDENAGMLFVFAEEGIYPFWMKNTYLALDIIWLDSSYTVVYIRHNAVPQDLTSINPGVPARYVLEFNAGTAQKIGLEIGDTFTIDYP